MKKNEYPLTFLTTEVNQDKINRIGFVESKDIRIGKVIIEKPDWLHKGDMFIFAKRTGDKQEKFFHIGQAHEAHEKEKNEDRS